MPNLLLNAVKENNVVALESLLQNAETAALLTVPVSFANLGRASYLHVAVFTKNLVVAKLLLACSPDQIKAKSSRTGQTPLLLALEMHSEENTLSRELIAYLLEHGASANEVSEFDEQSGIHFAILNDNVPVEFIKTLIEKYNADVTQKNKKEENVLHLSVIASARNEARSLELLSFFLKNSKLNINEQNAEGFSPLHLAALVSTSSCNVLEFLLENQADAALESKDGRTSLEVAMDEGHHEAVKVLMKKMSELHLNQIMSRRKLSPISSPQDFDPSELMKTAVASPSQHPPPASMDSSWEVIEQVHPLASAITVSSSEPPSEVIQNSITDEQASTTTKTDDAEWEVLEEADILNLSQKPGEASAKTTEEVVVEDNNSAKIAVMAVDPSKAPPKETCSHTASILQHIAMEGYPVEIHEAVTEDGFILKIFRIPHGKKGKHATVQKKPVVFLQHGCFNSSNTWVITGPSSLAFILADAGYDVWMGNNRGTQFGRKHKTLTEKNIDFWKFSWHEMGCYDFPAQIKHVIKHTGALSLSYVGHSQGTTQAFVGLSTHPDIQQYINVFVALAPVATLKNQRSNALKLLSLSDLAGGLSYMGFGEIAHAGLSRNFLPTISKVITYGSIWGLMMDCNIDPAYVHTLCKHEPSPTSTHNVSHWNQLITIGKFAPYDWKDKKKNKEKYGQETPPEYNLANIDKTPIVVFYGKYDYLSNPTDVEQFLLPKLKTKQYALFLDDFKHNDFCWGSQASKKVYPVALEFIKRYNVNTYPAVETTTSSTPSSNSSL